MLVQVLGVDGNRLLLGRGWSIDKLLQLFRMKRAWVDAIGDEHLLSADGGIVDGHPKARPTWQGSMAAPIYKKSCPGGKGCLGLGELPKDLDLEA